MDQLTQLFNAQRAAAAAQVSATAVAVRHALEPMRTELVKLRSHSGLTCDRDWLAVRAMVYMHDAVEKQTVLLARLEQYLSRFESMSLIEYQRESTEIFTELDQANKQIETARALFTEACR